MRALLAAFTALSFAACQNGDGDNPALCKVDGTASIEIGVPDSENFILYREHQDGGDIPMSSSGQAGVGMMVAVRAENLSPTITVAASITWTPPGEDPRVSDVERADRLICRDGELFLVPIIMASEFLSNDPVELEGEDVDVEVMLTDALGNSASATTTGVLTRL